jgi:hypothetical protein
MKSSRIASVSDELRGEKIDIIRWSGDAVGFIHNALAPAKVLTVELFEDEGVGLVVVPDYQLSLAIGREGQNVRLAARLTGWRLDITSEAEAEESRARYLVEREERANVEPAEPVHGDEADAETEGEGSASVDPELIRKLEEFRRQMFDPATRAGGEAPEQETQEEHRPAGIRSGPASGVAGGRRKGPWFGSLVREPAGRSIPRARVPPGAAHIFARRNVRPGRSRISAIRGSRKRRRVPTGIVRSPFAPEAMTCMISGCLTARFSVAELTMGPGRRRTGVAGRLRSKLHEVDEFPDAARDAAFGL